MSHLLFQRCSLFLALSWSLAGCRLCLPEPVGSGGIPLPSVQPRHCQAPAAIPEVINLENLDQAEFLAFGGGGAPSYNEIALEKNMLYFQRSLQALNQPAAPIFFANGNNGQATLRYLDEAGRERFKVPNIPNLRGPATWDSLEQVFLTWMDQATVQPLFFYFTGHGTLNPVDDNNNAFILWKEDFMSVQDFTTRLDALPAAKPIVVMMAQCYSGAFANVIYEGGDPNRPVALRSRCGFFATTKDLPSVGCTPEVNEADYRDYSSSFFAGLTGLDRVGQTVTSADYNRDGKIAYAEAHAFAKIDEQTSDRPISTLEAWLQRQLPAPVVPVILQKPLSDWSQRARPERAAVIRALGDRLRFNPQKSFSQNQQRLGLTNLAADAEDPEVAMTAAYVERLRMELLNVAAEEQIQVLKKPQQMKILQQLVDCESQVP